MSTATATRPPASPSPPHRRITVDEYERIIEAGRWKIPAGSSSSTATWWTRWGRTRSIATPTKETLKALDSRLPAGWTWQKEEPVRIPDYDEPEPDIAIIRGSDADYRIPDPYGRRRGAPGRGLRRDAEPGSRQEALGLCQGRDPRLLDRQPGRPPGRGLLPAGEERLPVSPGLQIRRASPGHDRRPGAPSDRRRWPAPPPQADQGQGPAEG